MVRRPADRALQDARQAARLLRGRQHRDAAGARHERSGRHRRHRHRKIDGQSIGRRRLFELGRRRVVGVDFAAEHLRVRQRPHRRRELEPLQPHLCGNVFRALLDRRRHFAHDRGLPEDARCRRSRDCAVRLEHARRCDELRCSGHGNRHDQLRRAVRADEDHAVFQQSAGLPEFRQRVRRDDERLHRLGRLVA